MKTGKLFGILFTAIVLVLMIAESGLATKPQMPPQNLFLPLNLSGSIAVSNDLKPAWFSDKDVVYEEKTFQIYNASVKSWRNGHSARRWRQNHYLVNITLTGVFVEKQDGNNIDAGYYPKDSDKKDIESKKYFPFRKEHYVFWGKARIFDEEGELFADHVFCDFPAYPKKNYAVCIFSDSKEGEGISYKAVFKRLPAKDIILLDSIEKIDTVKQNAQYDTEIQGFGEIQGQHFQIVDNGNSQGWMQGSVAVEQSIEIDGRNAKGIYEYGCLGTADNLGCYLIKKAILPVISINGSNVVNEGERLELGISAAYYYTNLPVTLSNLPEGAEAIYGSTASLVWQTDYDDAGNYTLDIMVDTGFYTYRDTINISVTDVNRCPEFVEPSAGSFTVNENETLDIPVGAIDPDGDEVFYGAYGTPFTLGAVFDETTHIFSWTPGFDDAGSYEVNFNATDGQGSECEGLAVDIEVLNTNRAPVIEPIDDYVINENEILSFSIVVSDPDGDALDISVSGMPDGAVFDEATRTFIWTPDFTQSGNYTATFSVTDKPADGNLMTVSEDVSIEVRNVDLLPVVTLISPADGAVLDNPNVSIIFTASDDSSDQLNCSLYGEANWSAGGGYIAEQMIMNGSEGSFNFTDVPDGVYTWNVLCADGSGNSAMAPANFTFMVNTTVLPMPQCSDGIDNDNDGLTDFPADPGCTDANDNNETDEVVVDLPPVVTLLSPADGAVLNSSNVSLVFSAADDNDAELTCNLSMKNQTDEWNIIQLVQNSTESQADFTGLADGEYAWNVECTDSSGNSAFAQANFDFSINTTIIVPPAVYQCSDGLDNDNDGFIDLADVGCVNETDDNETDEIVIPPVNLTQCNDMIDNDGDGLIDLADSGCIDANDDNETNDVVVLPQCSDSIDNDGDNLIDMADPGCINDSDDNETDMIVVLPECSDGQDNDGDGYADYPNDPGCIDANDDNETDEQPQNHAPVFDPIDNITVNEGQIALITPSAADPDGDNITITTSNMPEGANFISGLLWWIPGFEQAGIYTVTFTATDGQLESSVDVTITVNDIPPEQQMRAVLTAEPVSGTENLTVYFSCSVENGNSPYSYSWSVFDESQGSSYSGVELPVDEDSHNFSYSLEAGTWTAFCIVSDDEGNFAFSDNITIVVEEASGDNETQNSAPVLSAIGSRAVYENSTLTFSISASDADNDTLSFSASNLPIGAVFDESTQTFTWTPSFEQAGNYTITFNASDGDLSDLEDVLIMVLNVNRAPQLDSLDDAVINETQLLSIFVNASDADNDTLSYSASGLPQGATFNAATQTFSWTPSDSQSGFYAVVFSVTDGLASDSRAVLITVNDMNSTPDDENHTPVMYNMSDVAVDENQTVSIFVNAYDEDNDVLIYNASNLPAGAVFNSTTQTFRWVPNFNQSGEYAVIFTVSDGISEDGQAVLITVRDAGNYTSDDGNDDDDQGDDNNNQGNNNGNNNNNGGGGSDNDNSHHHSTGSGIWWIDGNIPEEPKAPAKTAETVQGHDSGKLDNSRVSGGQSSGKTIEGELKITGNAVAEPEGNISLSKALFGIILLIAAIACIMAAIYGLHAYRTNRSQIVDMAQNTF